MGCLVAQVPIYQHKKAQSHWMVPGNLRLQFHSQVLPGQENSRTKKSPTEKYWVMSCDGDGAQCLQQREAEARKEEAKEIRETVYLTQYGSHKTVE